MNKKLIAIGITFVFLMVGLSGCNDQEQKDDQTDSEVTTFQDGDERLVSTEYIGGANNLSFLHKQSYHDGEWHNFTEIKYFKNGIEHQGGFHPYLQGAGAAEWLKQNTNDEATVLCWWDYGHVVQGLGERDTLATFASLSIIHTIAECSQLDDDEIDEYIDAHKWESNTTILDIATVLTSENFSSVETQSLIENYDVDYILTSSHDTYLAKIFFEAAGKNVSEFVISKNNPTEKGNETLVFQMWQETPNIDGLELVYQYYPSGYYHRGDSQNVRIFKVFNESTDDEGDSSAENDNPIAFIGTSMGTIKVELYEDMVPNTVQNFIDYATDGFYDGLVFHRVIDGFMIQGGGFYPDGTMKQGNDPIDLEIHPEALHVDGAIAMARTSYPDSATSQFFINDGAQHSLEPGGVDPNGYAVFGVVIDGMDVVRSISDVETTTKNGMQNWPVDDVIINNITIES